jgi:hypothetical protein
MLVYKIYRTMRHLQTYRLFESAQTLTQDQQKFLDKCTRGSWSLNPSTGLVDIQGDFNCSSKNLNDLQGIRFGAVTGSFHCYHNKLTSLAGAPETVGGDFSCSGNNFTSLAGAPQTVGGDFYCHGNELTSLKGAPQILVGRFHSSYLDIPEGKWGLETFIDLSEKGNSREKQLVAPLVDPKVLQQQIDQNPEGMLVKLKGLLKHPHLQGLRWPEKLVGEVDLLSDLSDIGL